MPSKKKKYNARFPPARIKKIMQSDEEVGKVAQAVPVIISRALELFVESLLKKAEGVTHSRNAKTLTPSHLKQCIMAEQRFDFLKDIVASIPDVQGEEETVETPRSTVSNTSFVFPTSASSSSSSTSSAPQTPSSSASTTMFTVGPSTPTASSSTPTFIATLPDQKTNFGAQNVSIGGAVLHSLPLAIPTSTFPSRSVQSTINPSVPVIVPNPSVIQHQHLTQNSHSILNPVGANSNPYIPSVNMSSHPTPVNVPVGQYMYHQHQHNPNGGVGNEFRDMNEQMLSYGVRGADGSLASSNPNTGMLSMYEHKNASNSYQYHHHPPQHPNQYHSQ